MSTAYAWGRAALVLVALAAGAAIAPASAAAAGDTSWICKPGQADDLCAGTIAGETNPPPGEQPEPLPYSRPADAPIDCFYLYPTQSDQPGPNADLAKDAPIRRVVVQQARMFSSVCDVYAPMYRQVTLNGNQLAHNDSVETAYRSARSGFKDYLRNHNDGRGFIMLGHSQGSAHTARLIQEFVDTDRKLQERFIGAMAPGANIAVPIGKRVGGLFENVPACTRVAQYGCVIAFSMYNEPPGEFASFSRVDFGYWIYPQERFSAATHEVICTNPGRLDGGDGGLLPLVNFDYLTGVPANESAEPWGGQPEFYRAQCKRQGGAHWLNLSKVGLPGDSRPDLGSFVADGSNYHVPEVNLTEGNLLAIAQLQTDSWLADQARTARLEAKLKKLTKKLAKQKKRRAAARAEGGRREAKAAGKRIKFLKKKIAKVKRELG